MIVADDRLLLRDSRCRLLTLFTAHFPLPSILGSPQISCRTMPTNAQPPRTPMCENDDEKETRQPPVRKTERETSPSCFFQQVGFCPPFLPFSALEDMEGDDDILVARNNDCSNDSEVPRVKLGPLFTPTFSILPKVGKTGTSLPAQHNTKPNTSPPPSSCCRPAHRAVLYIDYKDDAHILNFPRLDDKDADNGEIEVESSNNEIFPLRLSMKKTRPVCHNYFMSCGEEDCFELSSLKELLPVLTC